MLTAKHGFSKCSRLYVACAKLYVALADSPLGVGSEVFCWIFVFLALNSMSCSLYRHLLILSRSSLSVGYNSYDW